VTHRTSVFTDLSYPRSRSSNPYFFADIQWKKDRYIDEQQTSGVTQ